MGLHLLKYVMQYTLTACMTFCINIKAKEKNADIVSFILAIGAFIEMQSLEKETENNGLKSQNKKIFIF